MSKPNRQKCVVWSVNGVWILAESAPRARAIYRQEYGRHVHVQAKMVKSGFQLVHTLDDTPRNVTMREFVRLVDVYGDGIVYMLN